MRIRIEVTGVVQGVGFRPTVWRLARELGLAGFVRNSSAGVEIEVEGGRAGEFADALRASPPPLARIAGLVAREVPARGDNEFLILPSREAGASTDISPDIATCADCLRELADPADRRSGYPFTNCTNCGPRYSITLRVPYDRPNTTMAAFALCADCAREYHDPADRRFHAQPNACPACGPIVTFRRGTPGSPAPAGADERAGAAPLRGGAALAAAIGLLRRLRSRSRATAAASSASQASW